MRANNQSRTVVVVALLAAAFPLLAQTALADDFAPEITSFERTSDNLLGGHQLLTIDFTARDQGPAGLSYALFEFETPLGGNVRADSPHMGRASSGSFTATKLLSPWAASGKYTLEQIDVFDLEGNQTTYERGGSHGLDLSAADFSVDNPAEDVTTPTLTSARLFQSEVPQGTPAVVLYTAEDDLSGVEEVHILGWTPTGAQYTLRSLPGLGAAGPATWLVPLAAASGRHDTHAVLVVDRAGNMTLYDVEHGIEPRPPKATVPAHDYPDLSTLSFTVRGSTGDRVAPQMTQFSPVTPDRRRLGDVVAVDYTTVDAGSGVAWVMAEWKDGRGHSLWARKTCGDLGRGPLSVRIEDYRSTGTDWELQYVSFADYLGNQATYRRDGTVAYQNTDAGPPVHAFDISQGDFHLEEGPPSGGDPPDTSGVYCPRIADVSLTLDDTDVTYGDVVTTIGSVEGPNAGVARPIVAIHQYLRKGPRLVGVVEGDRDGGYEDSFTAEENADLTATFLGLDGPAGADPGTSRRIGLTVRPRVSGSLADDSIGRGDATRLTGSVVPAGAAEEVLLQRKSGRRWRTVHRTPVRDGDFSFVLRPSTSGTFRYRAVVPSGPRLAAGRSAVRVLTVAR